MVVMCISQRYFHLFVCNVLRFMRNSHSVNAFGSCVTGKTQLVYDGQ